jgi:hypothetical protein
MSSQSSALVDLGEVRGWFRWKFRPDEPRRHTVRAE